MLSVSDGPTDEHGELQNLNLHCLKIEEGTLGLLSGYSYIMQRRMKELSCLLRLAAKLFKLLRKCIINL